jgi:hypothetical protein
MGRVLGIVYRCIATHLIKKAGLPRRMAQTGAVTLIRRLGSIVNLNVHCPMLLLDGVCWRIKLLAFPRLAFHSDEPTACWEGCAGAQPTG